MILHKIGSKVIIFNSDTKYDYTIGTVIEDRGDYSISWPWGILHHDYTQHNYEDFQTLPWNRMTKVLYKTPRNFVKNHNPWYDEKWFEEI